MKSIPFIYHPTTITLIDDDQDLLNSLNLSLSDYFRCNSYVSAIKGKEFLIKEHAENVYKKHFHIIYQDLSDVSVNLEISKIYLEVYNQDRFTQPIIAIVDYDMPEMNGLDLARELKAKTPVKIIMLTGEADQDTAVSAFNNNEIDRFISKSMFDYHERLLEYIKQLQLDYFIELSAGMLDSLASKGSHPLQDSDFIELFVKICVENNIVEYYLLDESGSFLMYDDIGNSNLLVTRTEEDMQTFYELADGEEAPQQVVSALQDRKKLVFFPEKDRPFPPISEWRLHPATQLKHKQIYYSIIKGQEPGMELKDIISYQQFLHSN